MSAASFLAGLMFGIIWTALSMAFGMAWYALRYRLPPASSEGTE